MKCSTNTIAKIALVAIVMLLGAAPAMRADPRHHRNADVLNPNSRPYGKSYEQWSAKATKFSMELPLEGHPALDTNPDFDASYGQRGNVWFLGAPFGSNTRSVNIPPGKALFFVLINTECSSLEALDSGFHGDTEAEQRDCAEFWSDHIVNPFFIVNDQEVENIDDFRIVSPQFRFHAPTPWIFGETGGRGTSVADGYYVMLRPLSQGTHTIHFGGTFHFEAGELGRTRSTCQLI